MVKTYIDVSYKWLEKDIPHLMHADQIIKQFVEQDPSLAEPGKWFQVNLIEHEDGTATFTLKVVSKEEKKQMTRKEENLRVIFWLTVIAIVVGILAYA